MIVEITDREAVEEINRRAAQTGKSVSEVVAEAVKLPSRPAAGKTRSVDELLAVVHKAQDWFAAHRDPNDRRTPDEIVGYNEHGHFD